MSGGESEVGRVLKEGFLVKKGHVRTNWRTRWFKLRRDRLSYYKQRTDVSPIDAITLEGCSVVRPREELVRHPHRFELKTAAGRSYFLEASNAAEVESWTTAIAETAQSRTAMRRCVSVKRHISLSKHLAEVEGGATSRELLEAMQDVSAGVKLGTHTLPSGRECHECFPGVRLIDWLLEWSFGDTREKACAIALSMLNAGHVQPVDDSMVDNEDFQDSTEALYRFVALHVTNRGGMLPFTDSLSPLKSLSPLAMPSDLDEGDSSDDSPDAAVEADLAALGLTNRSISPCIQHFEIKQGILSKRGHKVKNWKARRFVLMADGLYYYRASKPQSDPIGRIPLKGAQVVQDQGERKSSGPTLSTNGTAGGRQQSGPMFAVITASGIEFLLQAADIGERLEWIVAIEKCIDRQRKQVSRA